MLPMCLSQGDVQGVTTDGSRQRRRQLRLEPDREKTKINLELNGILFNFGLPRRRSTAGYDDAYDLPAPGFLSPEGSEYPGISGPDGGRAALCIWDIWRIERG